MISRRSGVLAISFRDPHRPQDSETSRRQKDATLEENHTGKLSAGSALRPNCESD
jgi:hypothetical protein